jgi:hypothetical protein
MTTTNQELAIAATGLRRAYGDKTVLDAIDVHVPVGTVFSLLGPNGAGKTTTVDILSTLISADGGRARVAEHDLTAEAQVARAAIGVTGQFSAVDGARSRDTRTLHRLARPLRKLVRPQPLHQPTGGAAGARLPGEQRQQPAQPGRGDLPPTTGDSGQQGQLGGHPRRLTTGEPDGSARGDEGRDRGRPGPSSASTGPGITATRSWSGGSWSGGRGPSRVQPTVKK